jgi:hypothetical protein
MPFIISVLPGVISAEMISSIFYRATRVSGWREN